MGRMDVSVWCNVGNSLNHCDHSHGSICFNLIIDRGNGLRKEIAYLEMMPNQRLLDVSEKSPGLNIMIQSGHVTYW